MTNLVVGASGATGRLLVSQLLERGQEVTAIVRPPKKSPGTLTPHKRLTIIEANILDLGDRELAQYVSGCDAVASCLGHTLSWKGIFGQPRRLVTDATIRLCHAIKANKSGKTTKYVLMNTAGNQNRDIDEPISAAQKCALGLIRMLLPPHVDNEKAADYLRIELGQNHGNVEWAVVRPDTLINAPQVSDYDVFPSPTRSAIFNAGTTSRINVAHFMADLITNEEMWRQWKGKMPVIYNKTSL